MSETESSLSRFTANAAGVQSHEVGLKVKTESSLSRFTANAAGVQSHEVGLKVKGER